MVAVNNAIAPTSRLVSLTFTRLLLLFYGVFRCWGQCMKISKNKEVSKAGTTFPQKIPILA
jgi:hypothetical protein